MAPSEAGAVGLALAGALDSGADEGEVLPVGLGPGLTGGAELLAGGAGDEGGADVGGEAGVDAGGDAGGDTGADGTAGGSGEYWYAGGVEGEGLGLPIGAGGGDGIGDGTVEGVAMAVGSVAAVCANAGSSASADEPPGRFPLAYRIATDSTALT